METKCKLDINGNEINKLNNTLKDPQKSQFLYKNFHVLAQSVMKT